ncbi:MAG: adenylate kinase [Candidatus Zixiibacteriota bacterium]|nr:MAG: adenylate kinase [candidate division Zixibacteria bacterium]
MNLLFLGPPGSGKGTQAVRVAKKFGLIHLSTGDVLRKAVKNGTELGLKAESFMKNGDLVPDEILIEVIEEKITSGKLNKGFILDGFPRTIPQAESLKMMLLKDNINLDKAILLDVPDDEIIKRLFGRWFCPVCNADYNYPAKIPKVEGFCDIDKAKLERRHDDDEGVVRNRLEVYKKQTEPIIGFYKSESILRNIDGKQTPDTVFNSICETVME